MYDPTDDLTAFAAIPGTIEVPASEVPSLVLNGITVFSFGYGDGMEEGFDALDESDLWAWDDDDIGAAVVASWAPFRRS